MNSGHELSSAEGFGEVVIGADFEADDEIGLRIACRQHEYGDRSFALDLAADVEAVETREHEVEHHEIGPEALAELHARRAVGCDGHLESLTPEPSGHGIGDRGFVFHDQDRARQHRGGNGHRGSRIKTRSAGVLPELWRFSGESPELVSKGAVTARRSGFSSTQQVLGAGSPFSRPVIQVRTSALDASTSW